MPIINDDGSFGKITLHDIGVVVFTAIATGFIIFTWRLMVTLPTNYWHDCEAKLRICEHKKPYPGCPQDLQEKVDNFLKEHKRERKHFE